MAEQLESNSQVLHDLKSAVERLESKLSTCPLITSNPNSGDHSSDQSTTYASKVASFTPPASLSYSMGAKSLQSSDRDSNLVLFGLSETHSLIESKEVVDEVLEFLAGKPVQIRDMFRLGKINRPPTASSQPCPWPVLIKLAVAWDRKLVLLRKRNLQKFRIKRLFLREDLPSELRQNKSSKVQRDKTSTHSSHNEQLAHSSFSEPSRDSALPERDHSPRPTEPVGVVIQKSQSASSSFHRQSSRSISPTNSTVSLPSSPPRSSRSVFPPTSSSTLVQEPSDSH